MPNAFSDAGYEVIMAGCPYLDKNNKFFANRINEAVKLLPDSWGEDYVRYWYQAAEANNINYRIQNK